MFCYGPNLSANDRHRDSWLSASFYFNTNLRRTTGAHSMWKSLKKLSFFNLPSVCDLFWESNHARAWKSRTMTPSSCQTPDMLSRSARWASVDLALFRLWCYTPLKFYTRDRWVVPSDSAGNAYSHNQETDSESLWLSVNLCRVISVPTSTAESSSSITLSFCNAWYRYDHRIHDNDLVFCIEHEIFKSGIW